MMRTVNNFMIQAQTADKAVEDFKSWQDNFKDVCEEAGLKVTPFLDQLRIQKRPKGYRNSFWGPIHNAVPHSSKRQRARYARQIAAGQIRNASCVTW